MEKDEIEFILESQRRFFTSGGTQDINFRLENLKKLRSLILSHEQELILFVTGDHSVAVWADITVESRLRLSQTCGR
jgi:acyl-CoA reductase-like NAD-dependent aldehyde dehydrogenase